MRPARRHQDDRGQPARGSTSNQGDTSMTDVLDLSKETGWFEVAVFCYLGSEGEQGPGSHEGCTYSVDRDHGHGRATVYETGSKDKALGVAEYLETYERIGATPDGKTFTRDGEPFDGRIWHRDH
jgi:hypothetical protein